MLVVATAQAGNVAPATSSPQRPAISTDVNAVAITSTRDTFCVSDYGWSNTWFPYQPSIAAFDANKNVLGDSAQYLSYTFRGTEYGAWLTPYIGGSDGLGVFSSTGPVSFTVTTAAHTTASDTAVSKIGDTRVNVTITTQAVGQGIRMAFVVENTTESTLTEMYMVQYFNYFPWGHSNTSAGTMSYRDIVALEGEYVKGLAVDTGEDTGYIMAGGVCGGWGATPGCAATPTGCTSLEPRNAVAAFSTTVNTDNYAGGPPPER